MRYAALTIILRGIMRDCQIFFCGISEFRSPMSASFNNFFAFVILFLFSLSSCYSESYFKGNNAFSYSWLTFQIFSRNSKDGVDPVQYGDIVAFRYPYYYTYYWMYFSGSKLYARSCSYSSKYSCAAKNTYTGFQIFKQL